MKKLLLISIFVIGFTGCSEGIDVDKILSKSITPFKEYKVNDTKVAETVENGILGTEASKNGLDLETSSAHLISYEKIGTYGTGEVRILGNLTEAGVAQAKENRYRNVNDIVNYTCKFEYSYKTGRYTWSSDFPYTK